MTIEECEADCVGYTYFGVEYGGECLLSLLIVLKSLYLHKR
jgi:hypothetical protein